MLINSFTLGFRIITLIPTRSFRFSARSIRGCLFVLFFISAAPLAMAQEARGDSLKSVWRNTKLPDTTRMNALLEFGFNQAFWATALDSILLNAQKAYQLASHNKRPFYQARFLLLQGTLLSRSGDMTKAQSHLERGLFLADSLQNDSLQNRILFNLGVVYFQRSKFDTAIDYYLKALRWADKAGYAELQYKVLGSIGMCYSQMKKYDECLSYYHKALAIIEERRDTSSIIPAYNNIALAYLGKGDAPSALKALTTSLQLSKASGITWLQGYIYMNIGEAYEKLNEIELAINNYQRSLYTHRSNGSQIGEAQVLLVLADVYRSRMPDSTLILGRQALAIAQKNEAKNLVIDVSEILYRTYEAMGHYQAALAMHKLHWNARDSVFNQEMQTSIAKSEAQYEYEKKQLQNRIAFEQELTQTRLAGQRRFFSLLGVFVLLIAGGALYIYTRNVKNKAERAEALLKISRLRESVAKQTLSASSVGEESLLSKEKIEAAIASKLGETAWKILQLLAEEPTISNHEIAKSLFLSEEGVSSSLRRMYAVFGIQPGSSKNHKIALLTKAVELSISD